MPYQQINYSNLSSINSSHVISTALGNTIIEIQGELFLPNEKPTELSPEQESKYIKIDDIQSIKFGKLEIDDKKATLFIGTTQRLLGNVKKLDPPLGLMKFSNDDGNGDKEVEIVDIINYKIIFTGRPLPIM